MSIAITEDHKALAQTASDFLQKADALGAGRALLEAPEEALPPFWPELVALGWLGIHVPEQHGGAGYGLPELAVVVEELGLDTLPTIDLDVMSVALRGVGDDPLVQYSDPIKLFTHLNEVHGADAVNGMAGLMAWSQAPTRALGRATR